MVYGVTANGFVDKPIETILEEIETAQKTALGAEFDTTAQSPAGQLNGVFAAHIRELWEVAQAIYAAFDPDSAEGVALGQLAALTGTVRRAATKSTVTGTANLDAGVTLPIGSVASVDGSPNSRFVTIEEVTNSGGVAADVSVEMEAETAGVVVANAGTLTEIETPVSGWNSITNAADADLGEAEEDDETLRLRRETELRRAGSGSPDAIASDISAVDGVTSVRVFENTTDDTDPDGVPPHGIEAVVLGGAADDIAQAIWDSKAAGIEDHGDTDGTATTDAGAAETVYFSRPDEIDIYIDVEVLTDNDYPADGDTQIKTALTTWAVANLFIGDDVVYSMLYPQIFGVPGVVDVQVLEIGTAPAPSGTSNISIAPRELAVFSSGNITVVST